MMIGQTSFGGSESDTVGGDNRTDLFRGIGVECGETVYSVGVGGDARVDLGEVE